MRRMYLDNEIINLVKQNSSKVVFELIAPLGELMITNEGGFPQAYFSWNESIKNKIKEYSLIVFTMNNSFIITPLTQNGEALCCGSFAYDRDGNTMIGRIRFDQYGINFDNTISAKFDDYELRPYGFLFGLKF